MIEKMSFEKILKCYSHGEPPTATSQQKQVSTRGGKVRMFNKPHVEAAKQELALRFASRRPRTPIEGAIYVKLTFTFSHPKAHRKAIKKRVMLKHTRPDIDNLAKLFLDAISPMYFVDDNQVAMLTATKQWGPAPGIGLEIFKQCGIR
jgi:Holliday junction resolvase RusA-like endonuclease